jgi:hypothetical protein
VKKRRRYDMPEDRRAEIAEDVDAYKRAEGNMAMNVLVKSIESSTDYCQWQLGYFRGQFSTISIWLNADKLHTDEAQSALDAFSKQVPR